MTYQWVVGLLAKSLPWQVAEVMDEYRAEFDTEAGGSLAERYPECEFALLRYDTDKGRVFWLYVKYGEHLVWSELETNGQETKDMVAHLFARSVDLKVQELK